MSASKRSGVASTDLFCSRPGNSCMCSEHLIVQLIDIFKKKLMSILLLMSAKNWKGKRDALSEFGGGLWSMGLCTHLFQDFNRASVEPAILHTRHCPPHTKQIRGEVAERAKNLHHCVEVGCVAQSFKPTDTEGLYLVYAEELCGTCSKPPRTRGSLRIGADRVTLRSFCGVPTSVPQCWSSQARLCCRASVTSLLCDSGVSAFSA